MFAKDMIFLRQTIQTSNEIRAFRQKCNKTQHKNKLEAEKQSCCEHSQSKITKMSRTS